MRRPSPKLRAPEADHAACAAMIRTGSRSFHAASMLLPKSVVRPAYALYAFCRVADDRVDLSEGPEAALADLSWRLEMAYAGRPTAHPADRAFAETVATHAIPRALPEALLEGLAWDVEGRRYATLGALHAYAARVASAVGAMMTLLMGVREPEALARATDLGVAMQLTNIARDVGEDARAGRCYLPEDWLAAEGLSADAVIAEPAFTPALGRVTARLLAEADRLYARSEPGIVRLPIACRPAIFAARYLYAEIGAEVARRGCDSVTSRAVVSGGRKAGLLARALAATPIPRGGIAAPPLPATAFLVEAVRAQPAPEPERREIGADMGRLIELLVEFDRREPRGRAIRPNTAAH